MPDQRWRIAPPNPDLVNDIAQRTALSPLLAQVLVNRGMGSVDEAGLFLNPERLQLPSPVDEFSDLAVALELLMDAIAHRRKIAICGDYDADGMTSTALLLRSLRFLGADVDYAIPSRMSEGYGINRRIVEDFHRDGVQIILTVDNGIAAYEPIAYARQLGLTVIVTDHHDVPPDLPPAHAILNPKLIDFDSPYSGVAGVGVAYILAVSLAQCLQQTRDLTTPLLELFTLGTIADLAPLRGVNRRWVRRGLKLLPRSRIPGVQALIQVAGLSNEDKALKPEAIGFRLGPRINAIGRLANPQIVIELLTTDDPGRALELAMTCEQVNQHRQRLCSEIEQEAIAWCESTQPDLTNDRVLVVVQPKWHHGVIGIVASRLVERYGVPVFIGTYEDESQQTIRGSARGIPEFDVFKALQFAENILEKFGGHRAAGGFSLEADKLEEFRFRLSLSANQQLMLHHLKPLVNVDVQAQFSELNQDLCEQIDRLHPCGIENPDPVFWTENVRVVEQKAIGQSRSHLKLTLAQSNPITDDGTELTFKAIAWRWGEYCPMPSPIDIAYRLKLNEWNGQQNVELELIGVRPNDATETVSRGSDQAAPQSRQAAPLPVLRSLPTPANTPVTPPPPRSQPVVSTATPSSDRAPHPLDATFHHITPQRVEFTYADRVYACSISITTTTRELRIQNAQGQVLALQPDQRRGLLGRSRQDAVEIDISQPFYFNLIRAAMAALQSAEPLESLTASSSAIATDTVMNNLEMAASDITNSSTDVAMTDEVSPEYAIADDAAPALDPVAAEMDTDEYVINEDVIDEDAIELTSTVVAEPYLSQDNEPAIAPDNHDAYAGDRQMVDPEDVPLDTSLEDAEPTITREVLDDPWAHDQGFEEAVDSDDYDEVALEQEIEAALQDELKPLEPLVSPEPPINPAPIEPPPAVADLFLSTQSDEVEDEPTDLSQIQGLMTGAQLHSRRKTAAESARPVTPTVHESQMDSEMDPEIDPEMAVETDLEISPETVAEARVEISPETTHSLESDTFTDPAAAPLGERPEPPINSSSAESDDETYLFDLSALPSPSAPPDAPPPDRVEVSTDEPDEPDAIAPLRLPLAELRDPNGKFSPAQTRKWLIATLGESTWEPLQSKTQTDLGAAYRTYRTIAIEGDTADYAKAGDRFSQAIQRELNQLFFKELRRFLSDRNQPTEINGLRLTSRMKSTLADLLPLLGREWTVFSVDVLEQTSPDTNPFQEQEGIDGDPISVSDRQWVEEFLSTWTHPLAATLQQPSSITAIAQMAQLCDRIAADLPLYQWQFEALHWLAFGTDQSPGVLSRCP
jgi:single-stranded-DNA-specific exonuclease RecJ